MLDRISCNPSPRRSSHFEGCEIENKEKKYSGVIFPPSQKKQMNLLSIRRAFWIVSISCQNRLGSQDKCQLADLMEHLEAQLAFLPKFHLSWNAHFLLRTWRCSYTLESTEQFCKRNWICVLVRVYSILLQFIFDEFSTRTRAMSVFYVQP